MRELFSLYYYEVIKNKNKFIIMSIISVLSGAIIGVFSIYNSVESMNLTTLQSVINQFENGSVQGRELMKYFSFFDFVRFYNILDYNSILLICFVLSISMILSIDIVARNYKKNTNTFYIDAELPSGILKIKLSRIMLGISLYAFTAILVMLVLIVMNFFIKLKFSNIYGSNLRNILDPFPYYFPIKATFLNPLEYIFIYIMTCVVGIQSLTSIIFVNLSKNMILMRAGYFITIIISGILMVFYPMLRYGSVEFTVIFPPWMLNTVLIIISIVLITIDCAITKRRFGRGI
ncbi:hypothetical protein [Peptostreptococcus faecalis]|uniref:hypothetical protein n=1 Tax=Peptostreptococcus faecalis TaxID=2045015 RepID=UPI000C7D76E8|nr:hypothetical protein [Peptostreptococcus faecalis]